MNMSSDEMASVHISTILKTAVNTFKNKTDLFNRNLEQLKYLFNNLTSAHVNLNPIFMKESTWTTKTKAPMTYIHIFGDDTINVGIFILKPNMRLPLHNHPEMYGLLKVIAGTVNVTSYSLNTEKTRRHIIERNDDENTPLRIVAERMNDVIASEKSECCFLNSNNGNIHEIQSIDGPAAFIDILSPPYDVDIPGVGERKCSYFRVNRELEPKVYELQEINTPSWFWSDSYPYTGPLLK